MIKNIFIYLLAFSFFTSFAQKNQDDVKHHFMFIQYAEGNKIVEVSKGGEILWEHTTPSLAVMFDVLPNGNIIYAYSGHPTGVQEVDRQHKIVWGYQAKCEEVLGFSVLPNGNILVGEEEPCRAVEVNKKGEEVKALQLSTSEKGAHRQLRSIRQLKNGNILACHEGEAVVREYSPEGKIIWEYPGVKSVFDAIRLKNGNTLIAAGENAEIIEVTPENKIVWKLEGKDLPELGLNWLTRFQILSNGNLMATNFLRGKEGKGAHIFEITRGKKVVWKYDRHETSKLITAAKILDNTDSSKTSKSGWLQE